MKNKEINLSSASLDEKKDSKEKQEVIESTDGKEQNEKKKKRTVKEKLQALIERFRAWWKVAPKYQKALVILVPALLILGGSMLFFYFSIYGPRTRPPQLLAIDTNYIPPKFERVNDFKFLALGEPSVPRTEESPINGRLFTHEEMQELEERTPIAAIISNHIDARPTSNLGKADLVFETLVEGGITRFLAIYWGNEPNKVGPMRSARQYYLEWLSPFDPLFVYDGFAASSDPRTDARGNISRYGIKSIATAGAWRVPERPAPHDEYFSTIKTWEIAEDRGLTGLPGIESWEFKNDESFDTRGERFKAKIDFSNSDNYNVTWEYDKATNRYYRSIGGVPDTDLETGQQISAKNVVIQEVQIEGPVDRYNRLVINTTGSGPAAILQDGRLIYGEWRKDDRTARTRYYDNNDREIEFNRGLTWISAVRQLQQNFDIIEQ